MNNRHATRPHATRIVSWFGAPIARAGFGAAALLTVASFLFSCAHNEGQGSHVRRPPLGPRGRLEYDSSQLMLKSSDQVNELIQKRTKKAAAAQAAQTVDDDEGIRSEPEAIAYLKDAMRIALSRPDQDGFRAAAFSRLDRELADLSANQEVLVSLSDEAIGVLQSEEAATNVKATYVVLLENLMAEIRPDLKRPWARKIVENVRDARLEISDAVKRQQLMKTMARPTSPSETAASILRREAGSK